MPRERVLFVGFSEQDNLGIGYIASRLLEADFQPVIVDFRLGAEEILGEIRRHDPIMVGFSIIFQYHIYEFARLLGFLRNHGVDCHFTAGGHYPSLRFRELLELVPQLDSVVLFEGEYTCLELVRTLVAGDDWRHIHGIAYPQVGSVVVNPLRPLEPDLDQFPIPVRPPLREYVLGKKHATILAGRGCLYDCSFCSIRQFYSAPPGPLKRVRRPEMVVKEMELLHDQLGCSVFMFQDDDFPLAAHKGKEWVAQFCALLEQTGLAKDILWKVNCRPDEIEPGIFERMRACGLFLVYLGIESGTDDGLKLMNKHLKIETSVRGVEAIKHLGIEFDFGFMLFDPESTYESVLANLDFLEQICGDGSSPITFCKMLPYAETRIEHQLEQEGRLKGRAGFRDYDFRDRSLNAFYAYLATSFDGWIGSHEGILSLARWVRYYLAVARKYYPGTPGLDQCGAHVRELVRESNRYLLSSIRTLADLSRNGGAEDYARVAAVEQDIASAYRNYQAQFHSAVGNIEQLAVQKARAAP